MPWLPPVQEMLKVKIGVSEPNGPDPETRYVTLWGAPLSVKVAIDVVLLTTGQLQVCQLRRVPRVSGAWHFDLSGSQVLVGHGGVV